MARGIHDIYNGLGYVYKVAPDGVTIQSWVKNIAKDVVPFKLNGAVTAPFAAKRSSYGSTTFTMTTAGAGSITGVAINGVDQIPAAMVVTGLSEADCAEAVAAAINSFTPGSGYDYTAVAIGSTIIYFAPPSAGSLPNGFTITISDTGGVVTYTTVAFANGSDESGVYDTVAGSRYFLNADYDGSGISGGGTADPTNLTNAVEITKYFTSRGQQLGIFSSTIQANTRYTIQDIDRSGSITKVFVQPQSGITQTIVKINPTDFVEGDIVYFQSNDAANTITFESQPAVTVPEAGNIYLMNDVPWISNRYSLLALQFTYIPSIGPSFVEIGRSTSVAAGYDFVSPNGTVQIGATITPALTTIELEANRDFFRSIFVAASTGNDATAEKGNFMLPYESIDAALAVANSGDTIILYPGAYNCTNPLGLSVVDDLTIYAHPGVQLSGNPLFNNIAEGFKLLGNAALFCFGANDWGTENLVKRIIIECDSIETYGGIVSQRGGWVFINVKNDIYCPTASTANILFDNTILATTPDYEIRANRIILFSSATAADGIKVSNVAGGFNGVRVFAHEITHFNGSGGWLATCEGDALGQMGSYFSLEAVHIYAQGNGIRALNNIWQNPSGSEFIPGFYVKGLLSGGAAISLHGGQMVFEGDLATGSIILDEISPVGNFNPFLIMKNGTAFNASTAVVHYMDVNCTVQFLNYKNVSTATYLVDAAVVGCSYQLLSCYSRVAVNAVNVANSVTGTTLVVDAAIL